MFIKPNLNGFLMAALLVVVAHGIFHHAGPSETAIEWVEPGWVTEAEYQEFIEELVAKATQNPSSVAYYRLSRAYEKGENFDEALRYLRRANVLADWEQRWQ